RRAGAPLDPGLGPLGETRGVQARPGPGGDPPEGDPAALSSHEQRRGLWPPPLQEARHLAQLQPRRLPVRLGEDGAHQGGDHRLAALGHTRQEVAEEMDAASLPARSLQDAYKGRREPRVRVADPQLPPVQPAGNQAAQELAPEGLLLAGPHGSPANPSTSRSPVSRTPTAMTTAWLTMR